MGFIEQIVPLIQKHAKDYGVCVCSPIIAQAILESASGTSDKATLGHNYFGLKWRNNRCAISNEYILFPTSEQNVDGSYININSKFCKFNTMEDGVLGYFQWINVPAYSNLKGITDPKQYLDTIKADKYATSLKYVDNLMNVIKRYNLTQYDDFINKYYRVQCGAFKSLENAKGLQLKLNLAGFSPIIKKINGLYRCQVGAYKNKSNAELLMDSISKKGFSVFMVYN